MKKQMTYLWVITVLFFMLGMVNILFAWLGMLCMMIPFLILFKTKKKTFCQSYCPRASLFVKSTRFKNGHKVAPLSITKSDLKWYVLMYFFLNLFAIMMTTIQVLKGGAPMLHLRFLLFFEIPFDLPQLITIDAPVWLLHVGYRLYSMMLTTTLIGLGFALLYRPKTWCTICPVNTLSTHYVRAYKMLHYKNR